MVQMKRIIPTEAEMVKLVEWTARSGHMVDFAFGPSGVCMEVDEDNPSAAYSELKRLRGEPVKNTGGDGI